MPGIDQRHGLRGRVQHRPHQGNEPIGPAGVAVDEVVESANRRGRLRLGEQAVARVRRELGHEQSGRHALARHVADRYRQPLLRQGDEVVIVSAHLQRRSVVCEELVARHLRQPLRQNAPLHLAGQLQIKLQLFARQQVLVELGVFQRDRCLVRRPHQQSQVVGRELLPWVARIDLDDAERLSIRTA